MTAEQPKSLEDQKAMLDSMLEPQGVDEQKAMLDGILAKAPPKEYSEAWYDDPVAASRAFLQGQTLGWSDEIGAAVAAGMATLTGEAESYSEAYNDIHGTLAAQREEWAGEHGTADLVLNLAGGVSTGASGVSKLLSTNAVKNAGALTKAAASIGVGATEGGIAGAGSSDQGDRVKGAAIGTAIGAALPAGISAARPTIDAVGRGVKSIPKALGYGDDFTPLNLADEGYLGDFYRNVVGKNVGGAGAIKDQTARVTGRLKTVRDFAKEKMDAANAQVKEVLRISKSKAKDGEASVNNRVALEVAKAKDVAESTFRRSAVLEASPLGMGDEARALLTEKPAHEAIEALDEFWGKNGFKIVKEREFDVNEAELFDELSKVLGDDPALDNIMREFLAPLRSVFRKGFTRGEALPAKSRGSHVDWAFDMPSETLPNPQGKINGASFMEMRNHLARMATQAPSDGQGALLSSAAGDIVDMLDSKIKGQLSVDELAKYTDELDRWGAMRILRDSVTSASAKKGGQFTPDNWLTASISNAKAQARKGKAPLQSEATRAQRVIVEANEHIKATALQAKKARDLAIKKAERNSRRTPRAREMEAKYEAADAQYKAGVELAPGDKVSMFETLFNTGLLGLGLVCLTLLLVPQLAAYWRHLPHKGQ